MSSLSPNNEDAKRKRPRKSVGQMPQYLARDYDKHKRRKRGKKLGGGGKPARERDEKVGKKEKPLSYSSSESLLDDKSDTSVTIPRKKSRGATSSCGGKKWAEESESLLDDGSDTNVQPRSRAMI